VAGEKVFEGTVTAQQATVNLDHPAGIYTVVLKSTNSTASQKVTITK
jgi:hypothetical protein